MFVPTADQLDRWGLPHGPLAEPVPLVQLNPTGRWHAAGCPTIRKASNPPQPQPRQLIGAPLCGHCRPPVAPAAAAYTHVLAHVAELDSAAAKLRPEWSAIAETTAVLERVPTAIEPEPDPGTGSRALAAASALYARRREEIATALADAIRAAPDPVHALATQIVAQRFADDPAAQETARHLARIVGESGEGRGLLIAAADAWHGAGADGVAALIATEFTSREVRDLSALPRPPRTPTGNADPHTWAQAELVAEAHAVTAGWPDRIADLAHRVLVEADRMAVVAPPTWPPMTSWSWDKVPYLACYPVAARAPAVLPSHGRDAVVLVIPAIVAEHAVGQLRWERDKVLVEQLSMDEARDLSAVAVRAEELLARRTVTSRQRTQPPDSEVIEARARAPWHDRRFLMPVWRPSDDDGPALTRASRLALEAWGPAVRWAEVLVEASSPAGSFRDRIADLECEDGVGVSDDGTAVLANGLAIPVSRLLCLRRMER